MEDDGGCVMWCVVDGDGTEKGRTGQRRMLRE